MSQLDEVQALAANNTAGEFAITGDSLAVLFYALDFVQSLDNWRDYPDEELSATDIDAIQELVDNATDQLMRPIVLDYPDVFSINVLTAVLTGGTTLSRAVNTSQIGNVHTEVTPFTAAGNSIDFSFYAKQGVYTIRYMGIRGTNLGNVTMKIDGTDWQTRDNYNASALNNVEYTYSGDVLTDGNHTLRLYVGSKNASSTAYRFLVSSIYGNRTGDL